MPLTTNFTDASTMATDHAAHHNALATYVNGPPKYPGPVLRSGYYYDQRIVNTPATATAATPSSVLCMYIPTWIPSETNIDRVGIVVTTASSAGGTARLAGYIPNLATGVPQTLIADWGTVPVDATGNQELTVSATLPAGWVLFAVCGNGSATGVSSAALAGTAAPTYLTSAVAGGVSAQPTHFRIASSGGTLPALQPTMASYTLSTSSHLLVYYRVA